MQALDRSLQRTVGGHSFAPPSIRTVDDIRRVVAEYDPARNKRAEQQANVVKTQVQGGEQTYEVSAAMTSYSHREALIRAFQSLAAKQEAVTAAEHRPVEPLVVGDRVMRPPSVLADNRLPVDEIIARTLGGYRNGTLVCWDLSDGYTYRYDVMLHALSRTPRNAQK